jgi:hypothetical protein
MSMKATPQNLSESLNWFIGSGIDQETLDVLTEGDCEQKTIAAREVSKFDETLECEILRPFPKFFTR